MSALIVTAETLRKNYFQKSTSPVGDHVGDSDRLIAHPAGGGKMVCAWEWGRGGREGERG